MTNKYFGYLRYVLRHKYYVFQEGLKLKVPIWNLIWHDWDKFLPEMFLTYAECYEPDLDIFIIKNDDEKMKYLQRKHTGRNKHHWQFWLNIGCREPFDIPDVHIKEMLADWSAVGRTKANMRISAWYITNRNNIKLSYNTRVKLETYLMAFYDENLKFFYDKK